MRDSNFLGEVVLLNLLLSKRTHCVLYENGNFFKYYWMYTAKFIEKSKKKEIKFMFFPE